MIDRRDLARGGALLALGSALGACATSASPTTTPTAAPRIDPASLVHPELRAAATLIQSTQVNEWNAESLALARSKEKPGARLPNELVAELSIKASAGVPDVTSFIVNAKPGAPRPDIVYMHCGGFITGRASHDIRVLQDFVLEIDCTIISVDYRLAPETTWRGALDDNYAGQKYLHDHAAELGVDPTKLAVMGGSAGGGHVALLAIAARDRGEIQLAFQSLTYPMLDDRTGSTHPVPGHIGNILWTPQDNRFGWR
jgi:acetyl esterase/lipase